MRGKLTLNRLNRQVSQTIVHIHHLFTYSLTYLFFSLLHVATNVINNILANKNQLPKQKPTNLW